ncbi:DUF4097 family beta strand repeat-containing protein (plasmid) [Amycolatopsis sp. FU40]|uniref:DUF4097 family beta strand repeat-containing protein n=1 Tax=Amycolatopsis sp. FU40 TaxID=2914159 RepID=UPI001F4191CA|nr:DUF4097 family beta strand repeat-containing protein [Amycolatopsis sp. FU40]UKD50816.1 DUF4097 family beta strand repeat-containing protein [Amycolatopsis sp. FU40]
MRTITHDTHTGPGTLRLRLPAGSATLVAAPGTDRTSVILAPATPGDQAAIDAINRSTVLQTGDQLSVTVPVPASVGFAQTVVHVGSGDVYVSQRGGVVTGSVTGVRIEGDGTIVVGSGSGSVVSGGGVRAEVRVPAGQRVEIDSDSADISADGPLGEVRADVRSGNLRIDQADDVELTTQRGDVVLGRVGNARVETGSGRVQIGRIDAGSVRTQRGDITVDAVTGPLSLETGSGRVRASQINSGSVRTQRGDVVLGRVGNARVETGSGRVQIGRIDAGSVRTQRGDITVDAVTGPLSLETGSGCVRAHLAAAVALQAKTGRGDIQITAEPGIAIDRSGLRTGRGEIRTS